MKSKIVKLTLSFKSSRISTGSKSQDKIFNILRKKRTFNVNLQAFLQEFQLPHVVSYLTVRF